MADYGDFTVLFSYIAVFNVIYTYGLETGYFRFAANGTDKENIFQTTFTSILLSTIALSSLLIWLRVPLSELAGVSNHPEYITWCVLIIATDTLAVIPFARLRQEGRPKKYAIVRISGILVNIALTVFFLVWSPDYVNAHPDSVYALWYNSNSNAGYLIIASVTASLVTFLLLAREWSAYRFRFDPLLWKDIISYCAPMIIIGMGGMVNETMDRPMLEYLYNGSIQEGKIAVSIYNANYKIAIFITLFITAFRMSAEPFFFSQAADKNAPSTYARVMKWFVIVLCFAFLFTALFLDVWKYFIGSTYTSGLGVVPILLCANVCLGIYYNLSVWYKLSNRMRMGMYITLLGASITVVINFLFIPRFGMYACAWATLAAYGTMMVVSFLWGQKYFPVPYNVKKLLSYMAVMLLLFFAERGVQLLTTSVIVRLLSGVVFMGIFMKLIMTKEKNEIKSIPVIGRFVR